MSLFTLSRCYRITPRDAITTTEGSLSDTGELIRSEPTSGGRPTSSCLVIESV